MTDDKALRVQDYIQHIIAAIERIETYMQRVALTALVKSCALSVNLVTVWNTVHNDLPVLKHQGIGHSFAGLAEVSQFAAEWTIQAAE